MKPEFDEKPAGDPKSEPAPKPKKPRPPKPAPTEPAPAEAPAADPG
ncbi:MAG: hypothetical protein IAG13_08035 [Deltaproteobacteria bacterium]|nr:hypothetical protein [Nannocystaceae bacterium]